MDEVDLHPGNDVADFENFRLRAMSEVVQTEDLSPGRWRLVAAWASFRRARDAKRFPDPDASTEPSSSSAAANSKDAATPLKPRKRVSLLLRRRQGGSHDAARLTPAPDELGVREEADARAQFRRAQSHLVAPVSLTESDPRTAGGEGGRYLEYAADLDDDSFERLRHFTHSAMRKYVRPPAIRVVSPLGSGDFSAVDCSAEGSTTVSTEAGAGANSKEAEVVRRLSAAQLSEAGEGDGDGPHSDEIIGAICLDDFADAGSQEEYEFLEGESMDYCVMEPPSFGRRSRRPSLKLDSQKLRWIGNETEFAKFFADVGLDDLFDADATVDMTDFEVSPDVLVEWEAAALEHNNRCTAWAPPGQYARGTESVPDIRQLGPEFHESVRRRTALS